MQSLSLSREQSRHCLDPRPTIPVLDYFVTCGQSLYRGMRETFTDCVASMPISNAKTTDSILRKALETLTGVLDGPYAASSVQRATSD